ncbi:MAG: ArsR family transcriptional regulator [Candidatus Bathyarchaeota archaeon]|uniref:anaerobic ribonucleoside-triphosphate reductase n=1 Tax=Candidatus Bathycorpusculum sp. TaxID=2994959 RepID=UPI00281F3C47|nr:ArsR family transcriptional regulator [Candidatus Termiticorpusculum sp.]MCL2257443.1 ArsR family transcriptional regulator [Candidatus Termiticorpusculum sp.]MCL2292454.1 ArsR family transcriptional regulator [Candidatus Termiticorpusculum sp.]
MSTLPNRARGAKVLKAVSSPTRLQLLNLLFDKGALSYTELMNYLKMNPNRDAGRFAYHLKFLLKADLVEADVETKKYFLTDLGKMVLDVADRVERKVFTHKGMLVRTSRFTLEEFDQNKIANSLIKEAKVPVELAQSVAKETEKRLLKSKTKYITAALIREMVNVILVEKGFEDYRHKLTRVGMPVHEVTAFIEAKDQNLDASAMLYKAGQNLIEEYTLLNIFSRDIADAHISGSINIDDLSTWLLKPHEIVHDMRFFFLNGLKFTDITQVSLEPPKNFKAALSIALNVFLHSEREISYQQVFSYFTTFLAPYIKNIDENTIKETLFLFILNLNQNTKITLELDFTVPKHLAEKQAIGPNGQFNGKYKDYNTEIGLLSTLLLQVYSEITTSRPLTNPKIVIKLDPKILNDKNLQDILLKTHTLAAQHGMLYFANIPLKETALPVFSSSGTKLFPDLTEDWETDTLRTGCLGSVTINLPRLAQDSKGDKTRFFELLKEHYDLAARALNVKYNALQQFGKNSLPFLLKNNINDAYFRLENCSHVINLTGLPEAVEILTTKNIHEPESQNFIEELTQTLTTFQHKLGRKHGKRLYPAILCHTQASERLAQLDIEKYGIAKVKFSGTRDKPFYSTTIRLKPSLNPTTTLTVKTDDLLLAQKLSSLAVGGSLGVIELDTIDVSPLDLLNLTNHIITTCQTLEFFTYNRVITFCRNCKKNWFGIRHKCSNCGSMSTLDTFDRFNSI